MVKQIIDFPGDNIPKIVKSEAKPFFPLIGRKIPQSNEAEIAVLGGLLMHQSTWDRVSWLEERHFMLEEHRRLFSLYKGLIVNGSRPDVVTIEARVIAGDIFPEDPKESILRICECAATPRNAEAYANHLRELCARRELIEAAQSVVDETFVMDKDVSNILSEFSSRQAHITADVAGEKENTPNLLTSREFVKGFVAPDFIIDDIIQRAYLYSITGRTGDGKTVVMLDMAVAIGKRGTFAGKTTSTGRVIYLAGENPDDIRARYIMMTEGMDELPDIHFVAGTFDITETMENLKRKTAALGGADAIFVDTSAAYFLGDEENSNTQLGDWSRQLRELTNLPGKPAVIVGCHPIKGAKQKSDLSPRGGGAFLAEVDGNLCIFSEDKATTELHWTGKLRGPGFEPLTFRMEKRTSELVKDRKGRLIPSVVGVHIDESQIRAAHNAKVSDEDAVLETMISFPSGSQTDWAGHLGWFDGKGEPYKMKVSRVIDALALHKLVKKSRNGPELTAEGKKEAERVMGIRP